MTRYHHRLLKEVFSCCLGVRGSFGDPSVDTGIQRCLPPTIRLSRGCSDRWCPRSHTQKQPNTHTHTHTYTHANRLVTKVAANTPDTWGCSFLYSDWLACTSIEARSRKCPRGTSISFEVWPVRFLSRASFPSKPGMSSGAIAIAAHSQKEFCA